MAKKKLRIGVLFGGKSGEHEVSLLSAASILKAIDKKKYEVVPLGITKQGQWGSAEAADRLLTGENGRAALEAQVSEAGPGAPGAGSAAIQLAASAELARQDGAGMLT